MAVLNSLPDYGNLDLSGEVQVAAQRMEARAQEHTSIEMFDTLLAPLLHSEIKAVLDLGSGTGALARRIARALPKARVVATDKSVGMLKVAHELARQEGLSQVEFLQWDVTDEEAFPCKNQKFDLIVTSVMVIYLQESQVEDLIRRLSKRLNPGGILVFVEQDHMTDTVHDTSGLFLKLMKKDARSIKISQALGLRTFLRNAGFTLLPRRSHLWADDHYGPYTRELLERFCDVAVQGASITADEGTRFKEILNQNAKAGDFFYGLVYHRIAGVLNNTQAIETK
jgi:ubiquinone/menaquinone biosynthesis C-methylase UbiE